jgi:mannose/cellobiose epimerase-like protein (N-acyl-D-glucosamine 2-epimerase family)
MRDRPTQGTTHRAPRPDVPSRGMATPRRKTLLEPGHEAEWAELNREKREYHQTVARSLTPSERVARGQKLSQQAVRLLASTIRAGNVPPRAFWS